MLDSILIDVVKRSANEARDYAESCMGMTEGGIAVEIICYDKNGDYDYSLMIDRPFGKARKHREYRDFLMGQVKDAHSRLVGGQKPIPVGWEGSSIVYEYRSLSYDNDGGNFSVIIGAVGGSERQNRRLTEFIANAISE